MFIVFLAHAYPHSFQLQMVMNHLLISTNYGGDNLIPPFSFYSYIWSPSVLELLDQALLLVALVDVFAACKLYNDLVMLAL